jgi:2-amino-4-hydroxy-6-hydroxymethyldihydropteridine diphosphokinase
MSRSALPGPSEARAFLCLGGNIGTPRAAMGAALRAIRDDPLTRIVAVSSLYRTPPWGNTNQPDFLNAVAEIATSRPPRALLDLCLATEKNLKRVRAERYGPRLIDIDILLYDDVAVKEDGLEIPHPRMLERAFVLVPLAEIAPFMVIAGSTVEEHAAKLDTAGIDKLPGGGSWWTRG